MDDNLFTCFGMTMMITCGSDTTFSTELDIYLLIYRNTTVRAELMRPHLRIRTGLTFHC